MAFVQGLSDKHPATKHMYVILPYQDLASDALHLLLQC